jgi:hypothetical protein
MGRPPTAALVLLLALLGTAQRGALGFKDAEMKKCSDLFFCRTCVLSPLRARTPLPATSPCL